MKTGEVRFWNIWWTLTIISAAFTAVVLVLEAFGVFRDVGLVLSGLGLLITLVFGLSASPRSSLNEFRGEVGPRLDQIAETLSEINRTLNDRLPRLPA